MKLSSLAPGGVPVAWAQLRFEGRRLAAALCGVVIVTMSTLFQTGVYSAFFESSVGLFRQFKADLVLISTDYRSVLVQTGFPEDRVFQALGHPGVEKAGRVAVGEIYWRNPEEQSLQASLLLGVQPSEDTLKILDEPQRNVLKSAETLLFDRLSQPVYGSIPQRLDQEGPFYAEMGRQRVRMAGTFALGSSFSLAGNFATSLGHFYRLLPGYRRGNISFGLLSLKPGFSPEAVAAELQERLPADVRVLTLPKLVRQEQDYWNRFTAIGFIIPISLFVSLAVGGVVIYQILYTNVNEHLKEYATLRAMGYSDLSLGGIVLQQSLMLTLLGFPAGLALSFILFYFSRVETGLPFHISAGQALLSFLLTGLMSFLAGLFALNKLRQVDPADIFA